MFYSAKTARYHPVDQLPGSPLAGSDGAYESEDHNHAGRQRDGRLSCASLFLCLLFTLVNIAVTMVSSQRTSTHNVTHKNLHLLRRPSQYIRFEEIPRPSPPTPRKFNNYPITFAQIDAADESKVFEEGLKAHMTPIGTVVPEDRRVLLTPTISTIVQFRAIDWGMEDCELHLSLPELGNMTFESQSAVNVELYRMNQTYPLDAAVLSYQSRPPRETKIESIPLARGESTTCHHRFRCPSDSVVTFELALVCTEVNKNTCGLEWWQKVGSTEPSPSVYLTQHATA
ncbi:hypothetical protein B0H15DRAFT_872526 [Mycena belliarum]|uniref:Ubiquitin 3 binding protein But2 C-terminal domain-containing protein n=1 Tax=Mycena belliarum TaxID=1033014 RepID=A0AAD6TL04_9AGAR|nr:hypothetical protein B0H15DRAFT_872526 [Mycena belliae]